MTTQTTTTENTMSHEITIIRTATTLNLRIDSWHRQYSADQDGADDCLQDIESADDHDNWTAEDEGHDSCLEADWADLAETTTPVILQAHGDLTLGAQGYTAGATLTELSTLAGR